MSDLGSFDWHRLVDEGLKRLEITVNDGWDILWLLNTYTKLMNFRAKIDILEQQYHAEIIQTAQGDRD